MPCSIRLAWGILAVLLALATWPPLVAQVPGQAKLNIVHPLPTTTPPWVEGYKVRWPVRTLGDWDKQTATTIVVRLPSGGWLRPDGSDLAVQSAQGTLVPHAVLSHDHRGETIIQFARQGNEPWYWVYGVHPQGKSGPKADAKGLREGVTLEVREWGGKDSSNWAKVREGLEQSPMILTNAIVTDVIQIGNPARPDQANMFAASYRGTLNIVKEGTYHFLLNAEEAAFLFINGFKVYEQPGGSKLRGVIKVAELDTIAGKVDLKAGPHTFEVHHVVGDVPTSAGRCALVWKGPGDAKVSLVPPAGFVQPIFARAAALEKADGECPGAFVFGLDDSIEAPGIKLFLVRFTAQGPVKNANDFVWDFGDGTTGTGRTVTHVYFKEGDYRVTLKSGESGLPAFEQRVRVWAEPGETSPLSLEHAIDCIAAMEWRKLELDRIREIFGFLQICQQPNRWVVLEQVAKHLLDQKDFDLDMRSQFLVARMEALARLNRAVEALKLAEESSVAFVKSPALSVRLRLGVAAIHQDHFKDATAASKIYKDILDKNSRTEHPNLPVAAIRWGDLFAEAGDLAKADEAYRVAGTLGGEKFAGPAVTDAATRGALLRIAEQKLRGGEITATRQLLERVELEYPGRRLDGLYCFLKAESDRYAGRYEESQRHYEMIFKLPQWAGYRDKATFGIADCFLRMSELDKAQKGYAILKAEYPAFYETQKLAEADRLLAERIERLAIGKAKGTPDTAVFQGYTTGFEPDEPIWFGEHQGFAVVRAPGMQGPHVGLLDMYPRPVGNFDYYKPLQNLTPGVTYWIDIWYRDVVSLATPPGQSHQYVSFYLMKEREITGLFAQTNFNLAKNAHHHWHKVGVKVKLPAFHDGNLKLMLANMTGHYLIDRISIRPVLDRQTDSLMMFQQGANTP